MDTHVFSFYFHLYWRLSTKLERGKRGAYLFSWDFLTTTCSFKTKKTAESMQKQWKRWNKSEEIFRSKIKIIINPEP